MVNLGLKELLLASALFLYPIKSNASDNFPSYHAFISVNNKEYVVEKNNTGKSDSKGNIIKKRILVSCEQPDLEEIILRAFIEEEKEIIENEIENLNTSMFNLVSNSYSDSSSIVNKLNRTFKLDIPAWAFAFHGLNPKFFALQYGLNIRKTAKNELKRADEVSYDKKMGYMQYTNIFNNLLYTKRLLDINRGLIDDIKKSTEIKFSFTNDEIQFIKNNLQRWDLKDLEIFARKKIDEYKELNKLKEKKFTDIKETKEYTKYLKKLSSAKERVSLNKTIKDEYSINNSPSEIIRDSLLPIRIFYNSMQGPKEIETIDLKFKAEKTKINETKENSRLWVFSKNWKESEKDWTEQYRINLSTNILIIHPKETSIENIVEKSYNIFSENNKMVGRWESLMEKDQGIQNMDMLKQYAFDEIISHSLRGYIQKTKNIAEWIVWKIGESESASSEKEKQELLKKFKGYLITEIPIYPSEKIETARYFGFDMDKSQKKSYLLMKMRIERGTFDNLSYGDITAFFCLDKEKDEQEFYIDINAPKKNNLEEKIIIDQNKNPHAEIPEKFLTLLDKSIKINGKKHDETFIDIEYNADSFDSILDLEDGNSDIYCIEEGDNTVYIFSDEKFKENNPNFAIRKTWMYPRQKLTYNECFVNGNKIKGLYVSAIEYEYEKDLFGNCAGTKNNLKEVPLYKIQSEKELQHNLGKVRGEISMYYSAHGEQFPKSLGELKEIPDEDWSYNPKTGNVKLRSHPEW